MSTLVYRVNGLLSRVLRTVPVGTNLGLLHLFWMMLSGRLLNSRGALFPGLSDLGLPEQAVRRSWAALASGQWEIGKLLGSFEKEVKKERRWEAHEYEGFRPVAGDLVGFYRPKLSGCATKHYHSGAGKALPAIPLGMLARIGSVDGKRLPIPVALVRADPADGRERVTRARLLERAASILLPNEALVLDAGFWPKEVQQARIRRYVLRVALNFTALRADPVYKGRGRPPEKGESVRPLSRTYRDNVIAATPADREHRWTEDVPGCLFLLRAEFWDNLVLEEQVKGAEPFSCVAIHDPRYPGPLLLVTPLGLSGEALQAFYHDRWPIEQLPLASKQMIGASRQFVSAEESRQRLPELSLLAGSILMYLAATHPAVPSGFWDRKPKRTAGRLRRVLSQVNFQDLVLLPKRIRKKQSPTEHLPKGIHAHRRRKGADEMPIAA